MNLRKQPYRLRRSGAMGGNGGQTNEVDLQHYLSDLISSLG